MGSNKRSRRLFRFDEPAAASLGSVVDSAAAALLGETITFSSSTSVFISDSDPTSELDSDGDCSDDKAFKPNPTVFCPIFETAFVAKNPVPTN